MEKETVVAHLEIINGQPMVRVKDQATTTQHLIEYLKYGVKKEDIKACAPKYKDGKTIYRFKVFDDHGVFSNYFVIKVNSNERYLHKDAIKQINEVANTSNLIKKVNINRFIAGISAGIVLMTLAGPSIAKGLKELDQKDHEYDQQRYEQYQAPAQITPEQKKESIEQYYKDLEEKAKAGDEAAIKEYSQYLVEQQLKQQNVEESSKVR